MAAALKGTEPLDVVVNNAGYFPAGADDLTAGPNYEENLKQYNICAVGPLRVTHALLAAGLIKAPGGKVILITSQGGSLEWRQIQNKDKGGDYGHHVTLTTHPLLRAKPRHVSGTAAAALQGRQWRRLRCPWRLTLPCPWRRTPDVQGRRQHVWRADGRGTATAGHRSRQFASGVQ